MHSPRVLADECVWGPVVACLQRAGFDVIRSPRAGQADSPDDDEVLAFAVSEQRVLVTLDVGDYYILHDDYRQHGRTHYGIVVGIPAWA